MAVLTWLESAAGVLSPLFLRILNMSAAASYVIAAVLLLRLCCRKLPKKYIFPAWAAVAFRLVSPVSIKSVFSIFHLRFFDMAPVADGGALTFIPYDVAMMNEPRVYTGIAVLNDALSGSLPAPQPGDSMNPLQVWEALFTLIWVFGMLLLLGYGLWSILRLKKHLRTAVPLAGEMGVLECEGIASPFVWGIFRPRIYIPFRMGEKERNQVLLHERAHIRSGDTCIKPFAFLLLAVHWFNPLAWAACFFLCRDLEMRADEAVLFSLREKERQDYGRTLLSFAAAEQRASTMPLGFGEGSIKRRIKNILAFRKPKKWIGELAAVLAVLLVLAAVSNPRAAKETEERELAVPGGRIAYRFVQCLYMTPLSSYRVPEEGTGELYIRAGSKFLIADAETLETKQEFTEISWKFEYFDEEWYYGTLFAEGTEHGRSLFTGPDISGYERTQRAVIDENHMLFRMDEEIWYVKLGRHGGAHAGEPYCWSIYRLERVE